MIFSTNRDWIAKRIYGILRHVFETDPITFIVNRPYGLFGWGGVMYVVGKNQEEIAEKINSNKELTDYINNNAIKFNKIDIPLTTDNWPYLYLKDKTIPTLYLCIIVSLLAVFLGSTKIFPFSFKKIDPKFFFLGTAFLLLEFQNVSKSCLIFGSTWLVNTYIISAILFLILLANIIVNYLKKINIPILYLFLLLSIVIQYLLPLTIFNTLDYHLKVISASIFLNIPILFAGIIFIEFFKDAPNKSIAFASNLLGASFGGILESISFITGIKFLLLLVFSFYLLSYAFINRAR